MFQARSLDSRAMLEALKKLSAYALIKTNMTDTPYSRKVVQHTPHIRERLEEKTRSAKMTDYKPSPKEIAEAFSTVTGQEITEKEINLIQDIQLPDEVDGSHRRNSDSSDGPG